MRNLRLQNRTRRKQLYAIIGMIVAIVAIVAMVLGIASAAGNAAETTDSDPQSYPYDVYLFTGADDGAAPQIGMVSAELDGKTIVKDFTGQNFNRLLTFGNADSNEGPQVDFMSVQAVDSTYKYQRYERTTLTYDGKLYVYYTLVFQHTTSSGDDSETSISSDKVTARFRPTVTVNDKTPTEEGVTDDNPLKFKVTMSSYTYGVVNEREIETTNGDNQSWWTIDYDSTAMTPITTQTDTDYGTFTADGDGNLNIDLDIPASFYSKFVAKSPCFVTAQFKIEQADGNAEDTGVVVEDPAYACLVINPNLDDSSYETECRFVCYYSTLDGQTSGKDPKFRPRLHAVRRNAPTVKAQSGNYEMTGRKVLSDSWKFRDGDFVAFHVAASDGAPMPDGLDANGDITVKPTAGDDSASIAFGTIAFDRNDIGKTYTYSIAETSCSEDMVIGDTSSRTIVLTIGDDSDADGTLDVSCSDANSGLVFTNTMKQEENVPTPDPEPSTPTDEQPNVPETDTKADDKQETPVKAEDDVPSTDTADEQPTMTLVKTGDRTVDIMTTAAIAAFMLTAVLAIARRVKR